MSKYKITLNNGKTITVEAFNAIVSPSGCLMLMDDKGHYVLILAVDEWKACKM